MVLVHDDNLAQIGGMCTGNVVSMHFPSRYSLLTYPQTQESLQPDMMMSILQNYSPKIHEILCGESLQALGNHSEITNS